MNIVETYCDMCGKLINDGDRIKNCARISMSPKLLDSKEKFNPEWEKDFLEIDLCDNCYAKIKKEFMFRMILDKKIIKEKMKGVNNAL